MFHRITFEKEELEKLADYILFNKKIDLAKNVYFNRNTLIRLRSILNGSKPNNFKMNKKQFDEIINSFLNSKLSFNNNTPYIILNNHDCIIASLKRDINSVDCLKDVRDPELINEIKSMVKEKEYVLSSSSPLYLRSDPEIALKSIKIDPFSADYVAWHTMNNSTSDLICKELSKTDYVIHTLSPHYLLSNDDVILNSIKNDFSTIQYADLSDVKDKELFEYLVMNDFPLSSSYVFEQQLSNFTNPRVLEKVLISETYLAKPRSKEKRLCGTRFSELMAQAIELTPKISRFKNLLEYAADKSWNTYRRNNSDKFNEVPRRILDQLEFVNDFDTIVDDEDGFLPWMEDILEENYQFLIQAMKEYFNEIHGDHNSRKMSIARDTIFELSALYISKSKEKYKKERLLYFQDIIKKNFIIRKDNPYIIKRVKEYNQKKVISKLYESKDSDFLNYANSLSEKYEQLATKEIADTMIKRFLLSDAKKLNDVMSIPYDFEYYKIYLEAKKLVNRLNKGYIKYTDQELDRFRTIIEYDEDSKEYVYVGRKYTENESCEYKKYFVLERVFNNIKRDLMDKASEYDIKMDYDVIKEMKLDAYLPFTDEFYEFNKNNEYKLRDFIKGCFDEKESHYFNPIGLSDVDDLLKYWHIISDNDLVWFQIMISDSSSKELSDLFSPKKFMRLLTNIKNIIELSKEYNYDLSNYDDLSMLIDISDTSKEARAVLGKELVETLTKDRAFIDKSVKGSTIIEVAAELVANMAGRGEYTVPFVEGEHKGYHYSMYDSLDNETLLAGIKTDACFRVLGNDNDFLHYCVLDKNGFILKITDSNGEFVGRAAGFRNGNCIFINQLRTVNDVHSEGYFGFYDKKSDDIIEVFQKACEDMIIKSHVNPDEEITIDFVFVNAAYLLAMLIPNVDRRIREKFARYPVLLGDTSDWKNFSAMVPNLIDDYDDYQPREPDDEYEGAAFDTDYGEYELLCMASVFDAKADFYDVKFFKKMNFSDVKGVYSRKRNKVVGSPYVTEELREKINKISGLCAYHYGEEMPEELPDDARVFVGDNWFIAYDKDNEIITYRCLDFDNSARMELSTVNVAVMEFAENKDDIIKKVKSKFSNQS